MQVDEDDVIKVNKCLQNKEKQNPKPRPPGAKKTGRIPRNLDRPLAHASPSKPVVSDTEGTASAMNGSSEDSDDDPDETEDSDDEF